MRCRDSLHRERVDPAPAPVAELAFASGGTTTAVVMLVIVLLANGLLQNVVRPIAFGATA
jgi:hypothetical protein